MIKKKKHLIWVIIGSLMISMISFSYASVSSEAATCETIGMIVGTGDGVTPEYLATNPKRYQAAVLFLRLKGLEDEMYSYDYEGKDNFSDVSEASGYVTRLLAYLYNNPELGWNGYPDGTFRPSQTLTTKEYLKVMLEALGYEYGTDYSWNQVLDFASDLGILEEDIDSFTVDDLCVITVSTLLAESSEGIKLIDKLIEMGVIRTTDAVLVNLVEEPEVLKVDSVVIDNFAEIKVIFNMEISDSEVGTSDFTISVNEDEKTINDVSISDEEAIITISQGDIESQDDVTVLIKSSVGIATDVEKTLIAVIDSVAPKVTNISTNGPDEFLVTFSESLLTKPEVILNNNGIYSAVTDFSIGDKSVVIYAGSVLHDEVEYTLSISGATDYAGLEMEEYEGDETYLMDRTAVTAEIIDVNETEVTLKFNKEVTGITTASVWHTYSGYTADAISPSDGEYYDEYVVNFKDHYIGYIDTEFTIIADGISDRWGNTMEDDATYDIKSTKDNSYPIVSLVEAGDDYSIVEFSEAIASFTVSNVALQTDDSDAVTIDEVSSYGDSDDYQYKITYDTLKADTYTLSMVDVTDASFNKNRISPNPTEFTFVVGDTTSPDLSAVYAEATSEIIYVEFEEAMSDTVLDIDYWKGVIGDEQYSPESIEFIGSAYKEVIIYFEEGVTPTGFSDVIVGRISDRSGNKVESLSTELTVITAVNSQITEATTISENTIAILVEGRIVDGIEADNIIIADGDGSDSCQAAYVDTEIVDNNTNTLLTVVLQSNVTMAASEVPDYIQVINMKTDNLVNVSEAKFDASDGIEDGIAPECIAITSSAGIILLEFDEVIKSSYAESVAFDLEIYVDSLLLETTTKYVTAIGGTYTSSGNNYIEIKFSEDMTSKTIEISTDDSITYIQDLSGNKAESFEKIIEF